jgi:SAM-dependent methyltransferase
VLSFSPLPVEFLEFSEKLKEISNAPILDLGSGQGGFASFFADSSLHIWELDRLPRESGVCAHVRGDALKPPILPSSLHCLLAGNLVRHLIVQDKSAKFLSSWLELLKPGGRVFIFEDEPQTHDPAVKNFKDLQSFLAQVMPITRGPLLAREQFLELAGEVTPGTKWESGVLINKNRPDASSVCDMLMGDGDEHDANGAAGRLIEAINQDGLSYGSYWWASAVVD